MLPKSQRVVPFKIWQGYAKNKECSHWGSIGQAKTYHGMTRSKFRVISKVETQFLLKATALNLKKMVKMFWM